MGGDIAATHSLETIDTLTGFKYISEWVKKFGKQGIGGSYLAMLAVAVAINPVLVEAKPMYLQVDLEGHHSNGRTIADLRHRSKKKPNGKVCIDVNSNKFKELFLKHVADHIE